MRFVKLLLAFSIGPIVVLYIGTIIFAVVTHIGDKFAPTSFWNWIEFVNGEAVWVTFFGSAIAVPISVFILLPVYLVFWSSRRRDK